MSAVNESIVREYFELHGFLVSQPKKYSVPGRHKSADEAVDLVVFNPRAKEHRIPEEKVWTSRSLKSVVRATIGLRGWHTERFYASTFEQDPEILQFAEDDAVRHAGKLLGGGPMAKILCIPRLPASEELRNETIRMLGGKGIDGILTFRTMLLELIHAVDVNRNYDKSNLLQVMRLLKNYELLKDSQMELFGTRGRAKDQN